MSFKYTKKGGEFLVLYTTHCPKCKVLEKKLNANNIPFETSEDIRVLLANNIFTVPVLQLEDGRLLEFKEAIDFANGNLEVKTS